MADQIAWTRVLGQEFTSDKGAVFASIQKLRLQAKNIGTLKSSPQQEVETKITSSGQEVIVIEPTNPQIVYVPQYNTAVVYTQTPTTVVVVEEDDDADEAIAAGLIGFTAGMITTTTAKMHARTGRITVRTSARSAAIARAAPKPAATARAAEVRPPSRRNAAAAPTHFRDIRTDDRNDRPAPGANKAEAARAVAAAAAAGER